MSHLKRLTFVSAALGSAIVTYNLKVKPLAEDRQKKPPMAAGPSTANDGQMGEAATIDECTKPIFRGGRFENPWKTWRKPKLTDVFRVFVLTKNETNLPSKEELDRTLPIVKPDARQFDISPVSGVRAMWVGHATVVAQFDGYTVITDPLFSSRASFSQWVGPKRFRDPACTIAELPKIDAVLISHNHYDHLDYGSVVLLNKRFGRDLKWFVPTGLKEWMTEAGCENVVEMSWWDEHEVQLSDTSSLRVACTPCQHWCKRGATDDNKVLWSSWCVMGPRHSFHFSGDTGYCEGFKQIGRKYGPFTLSAIPIGAYHPRWFMSPQHVDPAQAVDIHHDVRSKTSIAVHWGTYALALEPYLEPRELLKAEIEKRKMSAGDFVTVQHGAVNVFGDDGYNSVD